MTLSPALLVIPDENSEVQISETKKKDGPEMIENIELGTTDLFKHAGCRNATLIMFVVWTSVTLG